MESMTAPLVPVMVGVDTHRDVHVAAVVDQTGRLLATQAFPASTRGYVALVTGLSVSDRSNASAWKGPGPMEPA